VRCTAPSIDAYLRVRLKTKEPSTDLLHLLDLLQVIVGSEIVGHPRHDQRIGVRVKRANSSCLLAAVRYRMVPNWLLLGLLVTDPWSEERPLAMALYFGAGKLAQEMGLKDVWAKADRRVDYLHKAGYRRLLGGWHLDATRPLGDWEEVRASGWRRMFASLSTLIVPFSRAFLDHEGR
jgi:hypothetical protein